MVVPFLDSRTGEIPPGRYATTLNEVQAVFVDSPRFAASKTRAAVWNGFLGYAAAWKVAENELGEPIVLAWWLAGSFISGRLDPEDIDVTPVLDGDVLDRKVGAQGMGKVKKLIGHRDSVRKAFYVESFPLRWSAPACTLFPDQLSPSIQRTLAIRGGLDTWWQRSRPAGPKAPPLPPTVFAERGYLEVTR